MALGQRMAKAQKAVLDVERVAFVCTGGDLPHAHAHLVPMVETTDITSRRYIEEATVTFRALPSPGERELASMALRLRNALSRQ